MAFVPDQVIHKLSKITPAAGQMYLYFCRWRDHSTGLSRRSFEQCRRDLALKRATAYRAHRELLDKRWIAEDPEGRIKPLMGSFAPVDRVSDPEGTPPSSDRGSYTPDPSLKNETDAHAKSQKRDKESLKNETESPKIETNRLKNETPTVKGISSSIQQSPAELNVVDVEPLRARAREHAPQQQQKQEGITEEFLDHLQGLNSYRKRGVDVRDVLEKLMSIEGLKREDVTRSHLRGWCNREWSSPEPQQPERVYRNGRNHRPSRVDIIKNRDYSAFGRGDQGQGAR